MNGVHALGALVVLAALGVVAVGSGLAAWRDRWHRAAGLLRTGAIVLIALQVLVGGVLWLTGERPREVLHLLYGIGLLALFPIADTFAEDAPPDLRRGVVAVAALIGLALVWRLFVTG